MSVLVFLTKFVYSDNNTISHTFTYTVSLIPKTSMRETRAIVVYLGLEKISRCVIYQWGVSIGKMVKFVPTSQFQKMEEPPEVSFPLRKANTPKNMAALHWLWQKSCDAATNLSKEEFNWYNHAREIVSKIWSANFIKSTMIFKKKIICNEFFVIVALGEFGHTPV